MSEKPEELLLEEKQKIRELAASNLSDRKLRLKGIGFRTWASLGELAGTLLTLMFFLRQ